MQPPVRTIAPTDASRDDAEPRCRMLCAVIILAAALVGLVLVGWAAVAICSALSAAPARPAMPAGLLRV